MRHPASTVTTTLPLRITAATGDADIDAELGYDANDPLAVSLSIGTECATPVVWIFGRDLLTEGLTEPSGIGDITVEPAGEFPGQEIRITLSTTCLATMTASRELIMEFLTESYAAVPAGTELDRIDFDVEIASLLS